MASNTNLLRRRGHEMADGDRRISTVLRGSPWPRYGCRARPGARCLGEYYQLLHPRSSPDAARKTFGYRLLDGQPPPAWLQSIPYQPPLDLKDAAKTIRLLKVAPDQTPVERLFHFALAQLAAGAIGPAENTLAEAASQVPANARAEFHETAAINTAERSVAAVRASGDSTATGLLQRRLEAYRANRPWRQ